MRINRFLVQLENLDGSIQYVSIGTGVTSDPQMAHLLTTIALAQKQLQHYKQGLGRFYNKVEIIPCEVFMPIQVKPKFI